MAHFLRPLAVIGLSAAVLVAACSDDPEPTAARRQRSALVCDDGVGCTVDSRSEGSGGCVFAPTAAACDDGDACTYIDRCTVDEATGEGACVGLPLECGDANPCTDDSCDSETG